jgi:predicted transcriptional regulator
MVSVSDTLSAISNDKSLVLFNTIALASGDSSILISRLNLTRKQYYSRMSDLTNAGLILRKNGNYFLTSFGKVVYEAHELIGKAIQHLSKLKAIDSIESAEFPASELSKLIDTLINNSQIKEILISRKCNNHIENEIPHHNEQIVPLTKPRLTHDLGSQAMKR